MRSEMQRESFYISGMSSPPDTLRVLQVNSAFNGGGTDNQTLDLARTLRELGADVTMAISTQSTWGPLALKHGIAVETYPARTGLSIPMIRRLAQVLRERRCHIIHAHQGRDMWPTILAAKVSGVKPKVILTRHMAKSPSSWFSRRFLLGQCDALIAVSGFVGRVLREGVYEPESPEPERRVRKPLIGDISKIKVIHCGIDTERFRPFDAENQRQKLGLKPGDFAFVLAGTYDLPRGKGQREFLAAAAAIHRDMPHAKFLMIGRGNMADVLKAEIVRLGLTEKARVEPYCEDMPSLMNAMDCLVHPQIGTEAFGLVVCEAAACGKPVIASALDGIPEAFSSANYGQLVKPESVDELIVAMRKWAAEPPLSLPDRLTMHDRVAKEFSVKVCGQRNLSLYRDVLGAGKGASH